LLVWYGEKWFARERINAFEKKLFQGLAIKGLVNSALRALSMGEGCER